MSKVIMEVIFCVEQAPAEAFDTRSVENYILDNYVNV